MSEPIVRHGSFFSAKTISLGPNEFRSYDLTGNFLRVIEATGSFDVQFDDGEKIPADLGIEFALAPGQFFKKVTFTNRSATESLVVTVTYGLGRVTDNRLNVVPSRPNQFVQFAQAQTLVPFADEVGASFSGVITYDSRKVYLGGANHPSGYEHRKFIEFQNRDRQLSLLVQFQNQAGWATIHELLPLETWRFESDATISLYNPNGVNLQFAIVQVFYKWV